MDNKTRFSPASKKGHFDDLVDEGTYLQQSSLYKQILPRTPSRPKTSVSSVPSVAKNLFNLRNPRLIKELRACKAFYICRDASTTIESSLQIRLFIQNKPNFRKSQMNVNNVLTREYEKMDTWWSGKKQSQTNPNKAKSKKAKMNVNSCFTMNYVQKTMNYEIRNEPKTNPIYRGVASGEAGTNPIKPNPPSPTDEQLAKQLP